MRCLLPCFLAVSAVASGIGQVVPPTPPQTASDIAQDLLLQALIQEALKKNPGIAKAQALTSAEAERIAPSRALPDPLLSLGIQNDGFKKLQIGQMEGSYYQIMLTQPLPWPGKRQLRGAVAQGNLNATKYQVQRSRLSLTAEMKRAYLGLLLSRSQKILLTKQEKLWSQAIEAAKQRYEVGQGSQADLLRAQLELTRLAQSRITLEATEKNLQAAVNRLRSVALETRVDTSPKMPESPWEDTHLAHWLVQTQAISPELHSAISDQKAAESAWELARKDRYPDFALSAGVMPRGSLDTMWQLGLSITLPVWAKQKQHQAVLEKEHRQRAASLEVENVQQLLEQRVFERKAQMEAAQASLALYRKGLLVQSESVCQATLAQFEVGRAGFITVLEAIYGWIADESGYLQAQAQAHAIQIAQEEASLLPVPSILVPGVGQSSMPVLGSPTSATNISRPSNITAATREDISVMKGM